MKSSYFSAHTHTQYSALDGMAKVARMAERAKELGHSAFATTDHGNMAATVQAYQACKRLGLKYFPGIENYLIDPRYEGDWEHPARGDKVGRYHFGLLAVDEEGYKALVKFTSLTHTRPRFNRFPRCTLADIAALGQQHGEHLVLTTGCYFGLVQQTLVHEGFAAALKTVKMLAAWYPNTYVEVQHHNIEHGTDDGVLPEYGSDTDIVNALFDIAETLTLPVIATQDAHYCDSSEKKAHALMKRMTYGGTDDEFPGDSFHMASGDWVAEHYTKEQWRIIEGGFASLLDLNDMQITPLDDFKPDVPHVTKTPKREVRAACLKGLSHYDRYLNANASLKQKYDDRIDYELGVINHLGMASYFVVCKMFADWCREERIAIEARGSGNGSLVLYLLGITSVDPVLRNVDFDRFLSVDRIKPPDVDMDIEDAERPRAVQWFLSTFGGVQIGTWGKLGVTYDEREDKETGSVLVTYLSSKRRECEEIAANKVTRKGDVKAYAMGIFNRKYGDIKDIRDVERHSKKDYEGLRAMVAMNSVFKSYGVHAGGILLSGQRVKIEEYIPTMLVASSDTRVSQYDMDDVEQFGLLKMDVLGQATLRVMKIAQQLLGREDPTDFSWIPDDDKAACAILREGRTDNGIFHFEGYTKAKGGREMGIRSTKDAILASALYMPGAMESGQTAHFVRARRDSDFRRSITYLGPVFEKHLKETNGAYVYQNQVMSILRDMGMDIPSINVFLKAVKDSGAGAVERNKVRLAPLKAQFDTAWTEQGLPPGEREHTWEALCGFGAYGFNKAHATGYGIRSYRCAYLKAHHPAVFLTALLQTWAGRTKEATYIRETRRMGIRIMPPDINVSGPLWTLDVKRQAIRKGLLSIPGIGATTAQGLAAQAPYRDLDDMVARLPPKVLTSGKRWTDEHVIAGTLKKLDDVGALDSIRKDI